MDKKFQFTTIQSIISLCDELQNLKSYEAEEFLKLPIIQQR